MIAVIGSSGKHSAVVPTFGATQPVTRALKLSLDASAAVDDLVKAINELSRHDLGEESYAAEVYA